MFYLIYSLAVLLSVVIVFTILLLLVLLVNIVSMLITRVPPISTDKKYFSSIFRQIRITPETVIYDLGCGTGNFLSAAAKFRPKKCVGYELSLMPYLAALFKSIFFSAGPMEVRFQNFFKADLSDADIVYVYLVPPLLGRVAQKLTHELKPGAIALVKGTPLPQMKYFNKIILDDKRGYPLYVYKF